MSLLFRGTAVVQCLKRWPTDLAIPGLSLARGEFFSTVNGVPLHKAVHSPAHRPVMTEMLVKRT